METLTIQVHVTDLLAEMYVLQQSAVMCDTSLVTSDGSIEVHSLVLVSVSPNLLTTLKQRPGRRNRSKKDWVFFLMSHTCDIVQKLVHFIYTGEIKISRDIAADLAKIFKELQLSKAAELCSKYLDEQSAEVPPSRDELTQPEQLLDAPLEAASSQPAPTPEPAPSQAGITEDSQQAELDQLLTDLANGGATKECDSEREAILYDTEQSYLLKVGTNEAPPIPTPVEEKGEKVVESGGQGQHVLTVHVKISDEDGGSDVEDEEEGENLAILSPSQLADVQPQDGRCEGDGSGPEDFVAELVIHGTTVAKILDSESKPPATRTVMPPTPMPEQPNTPRKRPVTEYRCKCCDVAFKLKKQMLSHQRDCVKLWRKNRCNKCNTGFLSYTELEKHEATCTSVKVKKKRGPKTIGCTLCDYKCRTQKMKLSHMHNKHNVPFDTNNTRFPVLTCDYPNCKFQTLYMFWLTAHKRKHNDKLTFVCETCTKGFKTATGLRNHQRGFHEGKTLSCEVCGKKYVSEATLEAHTQRIHRKKKEFQCTHCPYQAFDLVSLESHMFCRHNIPFPDNRTAYSCPHCPYTTRRKNQYSAHVRRHTGDNPYQCDTCGKCFPGRSDLTAHNKWHADMADRKYKCTYDGCTYAAILPNRLQEHIRQQHTHKHVKPFKCDLCGYQTNIRGNLILHLRRTHKMAIPSNRYRVHPIEGTVPCSESTGSKDHQAGTVQCGMDEKDKKQMAKTELVRNSDQTKSQDQSESHAQLCMDIDTRTGIHSNQLLQLSNTETLTPLYTHPHQLQQQQHHLHQIIQPHSQEQLQKNCSDSQRKLQLANAQYPSVLEEPLNFKANIHPEVEQKCQNAPTPLDIRTDSVPSHFQGNVQGHRHLQGNPSHIIDGYKQYHFQLQGPMKDSLAQFPSHIPQIPPDMNRSAYPGGMFHPVAMPTFWSPQAPASVPPDGTNNFTHHNINDMTQM